MFKALIVLGLAAQAVAFPSFVAQVPNGDKVAGVGAIGHVNPAGGGARNAFGQAFARAGTKWTPELCQADSDGDGATNGEELGDPCCTWKVGATLSTTTATHPGKADTFTADQLKALKCATSPLTTAKPVVSAATPSSSVVFAVAAAAVAVFVQ
ncbi:hypothetical protein H310_05594 [Aphanomyces invadans]|uniref:Temptin Cys/Cys disulfide domain-containing protein n=1 Tax=Aphanomyces invadans TaxID=157072 RepID=A0A024UB97_9STRA|nr:hypothetical protein H310_05594 [Aphanomyces invadans]ETW03177.1 hypothetical protein H310_05594 [Aphanomyces invadans]|eukprot:XP_008868561.1 hypothetical protein H310_05594 [Aphanomyces invadans]